MLVSSALASLVSRVLRAETQPSLVMMAGRDDLVIVAVRPWSHPWFDVRVSDGWKASVSSQTAPSSAQQHELAQQIRSDDV
jgi:hypothetical protein